MGSNGAQDLKLEGDTAFRNDDFALAIDLYAQALDLIFISTASTEREESATSGVEEQINKQLLSSEHQLRHILHSNRSLCFYRLEQYNESYDEAEKCITINPDFFKGYIRSAEASIKQGYYARAFARLMTLPPSLHTVNLTVEQSEQLSQLFSVAETLPTTPDQLFQWLESNGERTLLICPSFFLEACERAVRVHLAVSYLSLQRRSLDLLDNNDVEEAVGVMTFEETVEDLETRRNIKAQYEKVAQKSGSNVIATVPLLIEKLKEFEALPDIQLDWKQRFARWYRELDCVGKDVNLKKSDLKNNWNEEHPRFAD